MKKNIDIPDDIRWELEALAYMEYIMYENTFNDLEQCEQDWLNKDISELSKSEQEYRIRLYKLCLKIAQTFDIDDIPEDKPWEPIPH